MPNKTKELRDVYHAAPKQTTDCFCSGFYHQNQNACSALQHQTGASLNGSNHMTHLILTHKESIKKVFSYIFAGTVMTGIVPMFLAAWLIMATEAFGVWVIGAVVASAALFIRQVIRHVSKQQD